jgi:hypothetical protein
VAARIEDAKARLRSLLQTLECAFDQRGIDRGAIAQHGGEHTRLLHHFAFLRLQQAGFVDIEIENADHGNEHHEQVEPQQARADPRGAPSPARQPQAPHADPAL